jgi:hypothetical protein
MILTALCSRRWILKLGLGGIALPALPAGFHVDRLLGTQAPARQTYKTVYRADAVITVFGATIFSRANVGSGFATIRERHDADQAVLTLRFGAGSLPDRARGLNRLGYIEEVVVERDGSPKEAAYFGFITDNSEETVEQAKKSLAGTGPLIPFIATDSHASGGATQSVVAKLAVPASFTWAHFAPLAAWIRGRFQDAIAEASETASAPRTFLYAIRDVMRDPASRVETGYFYNGKLYKMRVDKSRDANGLIRYKGEIRNLSTMKLTPFRFWAEPAAALPRRIEMQVRSYLKLAFEADPNAVDHS